MPAIREMLRTAQEARANDWSQYRNLLDSINGETSAEQDEQLERMDAALSARTAEIERLQRALDYEHRSTTPESEPDLPGGAGPPDDNEYRAAFESFVRYGRTAGLELRALATGTDAAGGYLAPESFQADLIRRLEVIDDVRAAVRTITTDSGESFEMPSIDEVGVEGAIIAENVAATELDPDFGLVTIPTYIYTSKITRVPNHLLQDARIPLEDVLNDELAARVTRVQTKHMTIGTGTGQPVGLQPTAITGKTAASATAITADELIDLQYSVARAYRQNGAFMMADAVLPTLRKLKSTDGNYIWGAGMTEGAPDTLWGKPIISNDYMPVPATGVKAVLFGDFKAAYLWRDVSGLGLRRLAERYAEFNQTGFVIFVRGGGNIINTAAYRALTML